jgi:hypothetical protein
MKKTILFLFLASLGFSALLSTGCKSEAKVDEDGASAEIEPTK